VSSRSALSARWPAAWPPSWPRGPRAGQIGWSDPVTTTAPGLGPSTTLSLIAPDADSPARVMVYSGTPLRQLVALSGPFVMTSQHELQQA
jgi:quercetin 2,3-dioxygenase